MTCRLISKNSEKIFRMKDAGVPAEDLILELRDMLDEIECRITSITGNPFDFHRNCNWEENEEMRAEVEALLSERKYVMNQLFFLHKSEAEITRFKALNARLYALTTQLYKRTGEVYRQLLDAPGDPDFDDDYEVEGTITYDGSTPADVLRLEDDDFYGSDFASMLCIINTCEEPIAEFVSVSPNGDWGSHRSDMSDKELGLDNFFDDGTSWDEFHIPELADTIVCHAVHDLTDHKAFSIPDFLRMDSFWCEVTTKVQHIVRQDGSRYCWMDRCSREEFIDKFLREVEHRPEGWSVAGYVRTRARDFFEDTVTQLDRKLSDSDVRDYLSELYDIVHK